MTTATAVDPAIFERLAKRFSGNPRTAAANARWTARMRGEIPSEPVAPPRDKRAVREAEHMAADLAGITRRRMFGNARSMLARRFEREPNWVVAMEMFGVGSTYAWALCREMGVDPESTTASPFPKTSGEAA